MRAKPWEERWGAGSLPIARAPNTLALCQVPVNTVRPSTQLPLSPRIILHKLGLRALSQG